MSGFNRLLDLFRSRDDLPLPTDISRHKGWGRVNQWMDTDAKELADALHESGCNATLCEFGCDALGPDLVEFVYSDQSVAMQFFRYACRIEDVSKYLAVI